MTPDFRKHAVLVGPAKDFFDKAMATKCGAIPTVPYTLEHLPKSWGGRIDEHDFEKTFLAKLGERYANAATFSLD